MLRTTSKLLATAALALALLTAATTEKTTTIFVIGDSTAANKDISKGKLERGWAMGKIHISLPGSSSGKSGTTGSRRLPTAKKHLRRQRWNC